MWIRVRGSNNLRLDHDRPVKQSCRESTISTTRDRSIVSRALRTQPNWIHVWQRSVLIDWEYRRNIQSEYRAISSRDSDSATFHATRTTLLLLFRRPIRTQVAVGNCTSNKFLNDVFPPQKMSEKMIDLFFHRSGRPLKKMRVWTNHRRLSIGQMSKCWLLCVCVHLC